MCIQCLKVGVIINICKEKEVTDMKSSVRKNAV